MNFCYKTVFFALTFILADILLLLLINKKQLKNKFVNSLDIEKREIYENIIQERRLIYFKSIFIGLLASLLYMCVLPKNNFFKPKNLSPFFVRTLSVIILYLTIYFSYTLHPKTDYMVLHLDTQIQREEWINIYKNMQYYYHISFLLSFISLSILYYGIC